MEKRPAARGLLLAAATLAILVTATAPAYATITPVSSSIVGSSSNSNLTHYGTGIRDRCPLSQIGGRTSADGRALSGNLLFAGNGGVTCTESFFSSSMRLDCAGSITLRSTSSIPGSSMSGNIAFDSGFSCTATSTLSPDWTIRGPQTPANCLWTFTQPSTLRVDCRTIGKDDGGTVSWAGTYITTQRFTIS